MNTNSLCLAVPPNLSGRLNLGHCRSQVITDVIARVQRMQGLAVRHTVGWDTFGLQVHMAAKLAGQDPATWSQASVAAARGLLQRLDIGADWSGEAVTSAPAHYRWQQVVFTRLWQQQGLIDPERHDGVAYWDPGSRCHVSLRQLVNGRGPESGMLVEVREVQTYQANVSARLAEDLHAGLEDLPHWDRFVTNMQRESIGRENGLTITFPVHDKDGNSWANLRVFTSRPDTIMGTTFIAVGTDHVLAQRAAQGNDAVARFCAAVNEPTYAYLKMAEDKRQEGMPLGLYAVNPANGDHIPVWVANYVVAGYGTNAVLGVPGHDQRNFNFAERHNLPIRRVERNPDDDLQGPLSRPLTDRHALHCNSGALEQPLNECKARLLQELDELRRANADTAKGTAWRDRWDEAVNTCVRDFLRAHGVAAELSRVARLRNWKITSQDYWGCPVPLVHCDSCGTVPVPEADLPVELPPYETGKDALADYPAFIACTCPACGKPARRDTDTLNTLFDTAWLHARLAGPASEDVVGADASGWLPTAFYCAGVENATTHLLCMRLLHHMMRATGILPAGCGAEPVDVLLGQGMVLNYGLPMSTRYANAIEVDRLLDEFGADTLRLYLGASVDPRHPLHWDDQKLFELHGILDARGFARLCDGTLDGLPLERVTEILTTSELERLCHGLLDACELAQLRRGTLAGERMAAVRALLAPSEIKRLQEGVLDSGGVRALRRGKLDPGRMALVKERLTDAEVARLQRGLLSADEFRQFLGGQLPGQLAQAVAKYVPADVLQRVRESAPDPAKPGDIVRLQAECLDACERAAPETGGTRPPRPLLRFLDVERMDVLLCELDAGRMNLLVNFIPPAKMERLLGFCGHVRHVLTSRASLVKAGQGTACADARRARLHAALRAANAAYGIGPGQQVGDERGAKFNQVLSRTRDVLQLLGSAVDPDDPADCALAAEAATIVLKLLHPLAPQVTGELWQALGLPGDVGAGPWPQADDTLLDTQAALTVVVQVDGQRRLDFQAAAGTADADVRTQAQDALMADGRHQGPDRFTAAGTDMARVEVAHRPGLRVVNFVTRAGS